jgi:hypothetical protein
MSARRIRIAIVGIVALLVLGAGATLAGGDIEDKVRSGESVVIAADETVSHDLYVFTGELVVDGTIEGDLVVGAGTVVINGTVDGDLVVGSGRVHINGEVTGDVRAGAGEILVAGTVGEDLLAGAGVITLGESGEVGEDLIFAAGEVVVNGDVLGSVLGTASEYTRNGTVGGSEQVTIETGGQPGPTEPEPSEPIRLARDGLVQFVSVVILGTLALILVPGALRGSESALRRRPLASAGIGIGLLVGYLIQFIAVILLMALVAIALSAAFLESLAGIAVWLGIIDLIATTFALVVSAAFLADAVVGLALARRVTRDWATNRWQELVLLIGGVAVVVILTMIPGIGALVKLVVAVVGVGAMGVAFGEWWNRRRPPEVPPFGTGVPAAPVAPAAAPEGSASDASSSGI